jgi:peptide/nickel transport system permease protein
MFSETKRAIKLVRRNPIMLSGFSIILLLICVAIFAPFIAPYAPDARDWGNRLAPPSDAHLFGTDEKGADILSKVIFGSRTTILLALTVSSVAGAFGVFFGLISAYRGGAVDTIMMRIADIFFSVPALVLAVAIVMVIGPGIFNVMVAIIIVRWPQYARLARGESLKVKNEDYVKAAQSLGASDSRIIVKHVLPNILAPSLVFATMDMGAIIIIAAGLSFLGLGAGPGSSEWGRMVADGRQYFLGQPWLVIFPGLAIFISVLSFNLMGDGLRDIMDPVTRRGLTK